MEDFASPDGAEKAEETTVFTCEGDGVTVTAETKPENGIPVSAVLHADKLVEGSEEYDDAMEKAREGLGLKAEESFYYDPYDIYFTDGDEKIEPEAGKVKVRIEFDRNSFDEANLDNKSINIKTDDVITNNININNSFIKREKIKAAELPETSNSNKFMLHILKNEDIEIIDPKVISKKEVEFEVEKFSIMGIAMYAGQNQEVDTAYTGIKKLINPTAHVASSGKYFVVFKQKGPSLRAYNLIFTKELTSEHLSYSTIWIVPENYNPYINDQFPSTVKIWPWQDESEIVNVNTATFIGSGSSYICPLITSFMFAGCTKITSIDTSGLSFQNITDMKYMFFNCNKLNSLNTSGWTCNRTVGMKSTFEGCGSLVSIDLSNFNNASVSNLEGTFKNCKSLQSLNFSIVNINTGSSTNRLDETFANCSNLTSIDLSHWDMQYIFSMNSTFLNCSNLSSLDLSDCNLQNIINLNSTFSGCSELTTLDLSSLASNKKDSNVDLDNAFTNCKKLKNLKLPRTIKTQTMYQTFQNCQSLMYLDFSKWNVTFEVNDYSMTKNLQGTFANCFNLISLDISSFNISMTGHVGGGHILYCQNMLLNCKSLSRIVLGSNTHLLAHRDWDDYSTFFGYGTKSLNPVVSGDPGDLIDYDYKWIREKQPLDLPMPSDDILYYFKTMGDYGDVWVRSTNSLTISKDVAGEDGDQNYHWPFELELKGIDDNDIQDMYLCSSANDDIINDSDDSVDDSIGVSTISFINKKAKIKLKHGQTVRILNLPEGANYTITEIEANQNGYTTTSTGETGQILKNQTSKATFTNTKEDTGSLKLSKTVSGSGGDLEKSWNFTIALSGAKATDFNKECTVTSDGTPEYTNGPVNFTDGTATVSLKHGQSITIQGLPAGVNYTVSETEANTDGYTTTESGATGQIEKSQTKEVTFTNSKSSSTTLPSTGGSGTGSIFLLSLTLFAIGTAATLIYIKKNHTTR